MLVAVTGASGFVGAATCRALAEAGHEAVPVPRRAPLPPADAVIDCAGLTAGTLPALMEANLHRPARLITAAAAAGIPRLVLIGSAAAYAPMRPGQRATAENHPLGPISAYGQSKAALHRLGAAAVARGLNLALAVPFNILGPGQPARQAPQAFVAQLRARPAELTIGNLDALRDWVDVRDIARALVLLAAPDAPTGAFNLAGGAGRSAGDLLARLLFLTGNAPRLVADREVQTRPTLPRSIGDPGRAAALLGWQSSIALDTSLRDMMSREGSDR